MHRLFVAITPPEAVSDLLIDAMEGFAGLSWQNPDQLHLTLHFIGEVERPVAEDVATALARIRARPFDLRVAGVGRFDHHGRGAIWAGVEPRAPIAALSAQVERACMMVGLPAAPRAYHPHLTIARFGRGSADLVGRFLARHAALGSKSFVVDGFSLFESRLGRSGALHESIAHYALADASGA